MKVNGTFLTWTGYRRDEVVGARRFQELLAPGDRIYYETHFAPALRMQGFVREIAVEIIGATGARLPVLVNSAIKVDDRGEPLVVRTALFDARERRAYETELLAARERAEELARTLQSTLLPPEVLEIPGLDVAGAYLPAGDGSQVGGDFYDVFETGSGAWGIVLGDVCGKGAGAAAVTAVARYAIRGQATRAARPSDVLRGAHDVLLRHEPDRFCTAVFATLRAVGAEEWSVTFASAGHHLPLLVAGATGKGELVGKEGSILGMWPEHETFDSTTQLRRGDVLLLYTDGITEAARPTDNELFGVAGLVEVMAQVRGEGADAIASAIASAAVDFQGGDRRDDIAVVVVRVPG